VWNAIAGTNKIDQLTNAALNNVTVNGITGLTASNIPDLSGRYLSISGGILAFASSTRLSVFDHAYFGGTATSSFDSSGALILSTPLALTSGGTGGTNASAVRANLGLAYASTADVTNNVNIATWGDSLTAGTGGTSYPSQLATLSGYAIYNGGVGGETSTQIKVRMLAATSKYSWPTIIWVGRNNYTDPTTVKSDIAAMVAALGTQNYLILGVLNGEFGSNEYAGGTGYNTIVQLNSDLATNYGSHFIDIRSYLVSLYNPGIPQDVIDHGHDIPPSSLRSDSIHLNTVGYGYVAQDIVQNISVLQSSARTAVTPQSLPYLFGSPPTIGSVTPGIGYFSSVGIGTTSPSSKLELVGNLQITNDLGVFSFRKSNGTGGASLELAGDGTTLQVRGTGLVPASDNTGSLGLSSQRWLRLFVGTGLSSFAGSVGIGTTTPSSPLEVVGNLQITNSGGGILFRKSDTSGAASIALAGDGSTLQASTAGWVPASDNTGSLGLSSQRWLRLFVGTGLSSFAGSVGIGTTSPYALLSISNSASTAANTPLFVVASTTGGTATTTVFTIASTGNVTITGSAATCTLGNGASATSCSSSDQRLKDNITTIDASSSLAAIEALRPVSFSWNQWMVGNGASTSTQFGFIAQEIMNTFPNLVALDANTHYYKLDYQGLFAPMVGAVQALAQKVADFADSFTTKELTFTRATGDDLTLTHQLCIQKSDGTPVCVTGDQLAAALGGTSTGSSGGSSGPSETSGTSTSAPDTVPPVITINGENPAHISVGSSYADLGAAVTDNVDQNLGLKYFLNGALVSTITIDTSTIATDTIDYVATDGAGNTATSSRTVIVEGASVAQ
jgi:hypothetical protein